MSSDRTRQEVFRRLAVGAVRPLRRTAAELRNRLEQRLHPRRHRRACEAVVAGAPRELLFVCLGNICRSPYAEVSLRRKLAERGLEGAVRIRSVGFLSPGRASPEAACRAAAERGVDLASHRSAVLTRELLSGTDLVLVMTSAQLRDLRWNYRCRRVLHLGDLEPPPIPRRDLPDPFDRPLEEFHAVYERIDRALERLAELLTPRSTRSGRKRHAAP